MAEIPISDQMDPTIAAMDRVIEAKNNTRKTGGVNLGMSMIGDECERKIWLTHRWATENWIAAATQRIFDDGYAGEDLMAERLRLVHGIDLLTQDPETGRQWKISDFAGHFQGRLDGKIGGLLHNPDWWHVWEHKQVNEKTFNQLRKAIKDVGEENALKKWKPVYYAQACLYMHYTGIKHHYMTVTTAGGRDVITVVTQPDEQQAETMKARAKRVLTTPYPLAKISDKADYFLCRFCDHAGVCHGVDIAEKNCRTCLHSTPDLENGGWKCERLNKTLSIDEQRAGCPKHLFIPDLVPGEQIDAGADWVKYRMNDGRTFVNQEGADGD